jgi:hypothetical protein
MALLVLCLVSVPHPSPPKQNTANTVQSKPQANTQPSKPPSPLPRQEQSPANASGQNGGDVKATPQVHAVRIVDGPPRSAGDTVALVCTIALTVVGISGICLAWHTLRAIQRQGWIMIKQARILQGQSRSMERQAKAAEDAAIAAKKSTDALANIERAWVDIVVRRQGNTGYSWEITNYGRTVAHIRELHLVLRTTPSDGTTASKGERTFPRNKLLVPQAPWPALHIDLIQDLGERTFAMVRSGEMRIDYTFTVRYEGIVPNGSSESLHYYDTADMYQCLRPVEAPQYNPRE